MNDGIRQLPYWNHVLRQVRRFNPDDPYERCGFLVNHFQTDALSFREVRNGHATPARNATITQRDYEAQRNRHGFVVGVLHTHPGRYTEDAVPSRTDRMGALKQPLLVHAVYHPWSRTLTVYSATEIRYRLRVRPRLLSCLR